MRGTYMLNNIELYIFQHLSFILHFVFSKTIVVFIQKHKVFLSELFFQNHTVIELPSVNIFFKNSQRRSLYIKIEMRLDY